MRIVTRPDFDGIVCAVLINDVEPIDQPIEWVEPSEMQKGLVEVQSIDIIANLPYHPRCALWFDHHYSNRLSHPFDGAFEIAPSAARVVYTYYQGRFPRDYDALVLHTDRIDAAELEMDEVLHPERHPYLMLSMTVKLDAQPAYDYWNHMVELLGRMDIDRVMDDAWVRRRRQRVIEQNQAYEEILRKHTELVGPIAVSDFRSLEDVPHGNRFLVYSLFPEAVASVKIKYDDRDKRTMAIGVGHSIFNRACRVNAGLLLSQFGGGGHRGAASCRFPAEKTERYLPQILDILVNNQDNEK